MSKITHTESIRKIFGEAVDGDSASIAYQADQLAQKLDKLKGDLAQSAVRSVDHARSFQRALVSTNPVEALDAGLFALVRAAGKGKQYVEAKRGAAK